MEHMEYSNTIGAIQILSNLFDSLLYREKETSFSFPELKDITESKLKELIGKL